VVAKGRIQEAIEKARLRREGVLGRHHSVEESSARTAAPVPKTGFVAMPAFPEVAYDTSRCSTNRILVPESAIPSRSTGAAAYRVLRTRLLQRARANNWMTIGVTSPGQGDGKSVTSLNLALNIAKEGNNNVFLVDLDMRNPKICQYLGATPPTDIVNFLDGKGRPEDVLFSIGIPNLTLAGTLTHTDRASELLASGRVELLFDYIQTVAPQPIVLLDLPPLLSTDDALVIAPKVDACLLVVAEGRSRRDGAAQALELLSEFNLAGIVLNRSNTMVAEYYGPT
jgi:Mrp family chromosome partitioning ATPase